MKYLLGIPSPRDIPQFKQHTAKLNIDKFWAKYYTQWVAYEFIRQYFLARTEYTHLIILPDDLLVKPEHFARLKDTNRLYDFPVLSGICNVDRLEENNGKLAITPKDKVPQRDPVGRVYDWISEDSELVKNGDPFQVGFNSVSFVAIRRDVVQLLPFQNDTANCCNDVIFANDCTDRRIPLMVDPMIKMVHLKIKDGEYDYWGRDKNKPFMYAEFGET